MFRADSARATSPDLSAPRGGEEHQKLEGEGHAVVLA